MISKQKHVYDRDTSYQHPTRMLLRRSIQHFKFYSETRTTKFCNYSIIERRNFATIPSNIALHGSMVAFISDMQHATASVPSAATISSVLECYSVSVSLPSTATSDIILREEG